MVDTPDDVASSIFLNDNDYTLWDKDQLIVIISRTIWAKEKIFFSDKEATLYKLVDLL